MTKPPHNLIQNTGFLLSWVAQAASDQYENAIQRLGFQAHHVGILELVSTEQPIVQSRIGEKLAIFKPVIVKLVNELEAKNLVERRPHPTDKRAVEIHLLPKGQLALTEIRQLSAETSDAFFAPLTQQQREQFHQYLALLSHSKSTPIINE